MIEDRPSTHLTWEELACHDEARTPYPELWRTDRLPDLVEAFERLRTTWGKPIRVLSAYRTPEYNRAVGGAELSQHVEGRALDVAPPEGVPLRAFWVRCQDLARLTKIRGLGLYERPEGKGWVHLDTRPSNVLRFWRG